MIKMKKMNSATTFALCLLFCLFFLAFRRDILFLSKINLPNPTSRKIQEENHLEIESNDRRKDNFPLPSPKSRQASQIVCDRSHKNYDICSINGPAVLESATSTLFYVDPAASIPQPLIEKIRPYPRKAENFTMKRIKEFTITSAGPIGPRCEAQHDVPALLFSVGGYTGNTWHDFNDGFIPLFITVNTIFPDQEFVFVISKARDWWVSKYANLLHAFSKHPIINLDNDATTHCFTSATIGLITHGFMTIDPNLMPNSKTFIHFRALLDKAYNRGQDHLHNYSSPKNRRPRLLLSSRIGSTGRVILNRAKVTHVAQEIGFDVIEFEPNSTTRLSTVYALVNSSHAMVGAHGAALTHSLFLRPGAVFMQVVPLGIEWAGEACFGSSARAMGLEYFEYRINVEESSLVEKYDKNDLLLKDPEAYKGGKWSDDAMTIYLKKQNVKLDLIRIRGYLEEVYKKAKSFMEKNG